MDEIGYNCELPVSSSTSNNKSTKSVDYEKYPSFDDQDSQHLSRNPTAVHNNINNSVNRSNYNLNSNQTEPSTYYSSVPVETPLSLGIQNEILSSRKISTGSMKSDTSATNLLANRKPLPSYSQIIQASKYQQQQPQINFPNEQQNIETKTRNSLLLNNQSNNLNLHSSNDPTNHRITQPYQQTLLSQVSSNPPQQQHLKLRKNNLLTNQNINQFNYQQSRSKSLDASLCADQSKNDQTNGKFFHSNLNMVFLKK